MDKNIILEVKGLSVAFDGRTVVDDVNFTLQRGHTLGIVGESGSGKSVSTMALMGLLPKQAVVTGSARLDGTELLSLDEEGFRSIRGKRISMIFQEPMTSLNPVQKCGDQVVEMMKAHANSESRVQNSELKARTIELFKEVLLPRPEKIFDSYPHEISGGQKQRVMIAMALINNPDIIIADEPTTALDVTVQKTILDLLKQLQQKHGISIIFITHDLGVIAQIADDIMVMYRGKVVEQGPAETVLYHPAEPYTRGLLACRPPLDSKPRRLPTVEDYLSNSESQKLNSEYNTDPDSKFKIQDSKPRRLPTVEDYLSNSESQKLNSEYNTAPDSKFKIQNSKLIEVHDLSVTYTLKRSIFGRPLQTLKGVDGLTFDIMEGETLGLVGESGCGKSTLGRALLRLIDHSDGSIFYRGQSLDSLSRSQMRALRPKLQIVFQDPYSSLNPRMTIGDAICEPLRVHKSGERRTENGEQTDATNGSPLSTLHSSLKERVCALMQQVGLNPDWYNRYPHELSGGQRQRVCIARALILQPELVVCDESVSALDVSVQAQVLNLLNDLKERYGFTYLFITHDLSVVHYMADRIMVMQQGRIVESGTPDQIFHNPQCEYTRTLIDAIPRIAER